MMMIRFHDRLKFCGLAALLLLNPPCISAASRATATGEDAIQHLDVERHSAPENGDARLNPGKLSQVKSADACETPILALPPAPTVQGPVKSDMCSNSIDALALSQCIYEITDLRRIAREKGNKPLENSLDVSSNPKSFNDIHKVLKTNLDILK
jgi:hypothetical protein